MNAPLLSRIAIVLCLATSSGCQSVTARRGEANLAMPPMAAVARSDAADPFAAGSTADGGLAGANVAAGERLLARSGRLAVSVLDLPGAADKAQAAVRDVGGFVQSRNDQGNYRIELSLRVPAAKFDALLAATAALGEVQQRHVEVADVTEEFVDVEARIQGLTALRDKLRGLLEKAQNVTETLAVERELSRVQTDLEALQGRMKVLRARIDLSSLELTLQRQHVRREAVRGPLGFVLHWTWKGVEKLFIWREAE